MQNIYQKARIYLNLSLPACSRLSGLDENRLMAIESGSAITDGEKQILDSLYGLNNVTTNTPAVVFDNGPDLSPNDKLAVSQLAGCRRALKATLGA